MGLGLSQYIPLLIYWTGWVVTFLSIFYNPKVGIFFLFPLLPYQNIFEKIKLFPLGKDLNDIVIISILIGWILRKDKLAEKTGINLSIILLVLITSLGLINGTFNIGLGFDLNNNYLLDWKNYMLLPLIWFLTVKNIKNKRSLKLLTLIMTLGIFGVDYYFRINIQWMNLWHFSHRMRDMMTGLFVYLGANHYGAFFAHFIFILLGIFLFDKSIKRRVILLGLILFTAYCLMYTYSRGAYIAFVVGLIFMGIVKEKRIILLLFVFFFIWRSLVPISVAERITMSKDESGELESSAAIRIQLWNEAYRMFRESPIIGKGFNTFQALGFSDSHNYYLKMLAELGILGLLVFLYLLFSAFKIGWKLYRDSEDHFFKGLGLGFATCVISAAITNAFGDRWSYLSLGAYFWVFLGIVTRANIINETEKAFINNQNGKK